MQGCCPIAPGPVLGWEWRSGRCYGVGVALHNMASSNKVATLLHLFLRLLQPNRKIIIKNKTKASPTAGGGGVVVMVVRCQRHRS